MATLKSINRVLFGLCITIGMFGSATQIWAHGGGRIQIANGQIEACTSTVWLNPPLPRANEVLHITVGISDSDGAPVLDNDVEVLIVQSGQVIERDFARTENSVNRLFYEVDFDAQSMGDYEVVLNYSKEECSGELSFPMQVSSVSYLRVYILGLFILVGGFFVFRWGRQGISAEPKRKRPQRPKRP